MGDPDAVQTLGDDAGPLVFPGRRGAAAYLPIQSEADFALWYSLAEVISDQRIRRY